MLNLQPAAPIIYQKLIVKKYGLTYMEMWSKQSWFEN